MRILTRHCDVPASAIRGGKAGVLALVCALLASAPGAHAAVTSTDSERVVSYQPTVAKVRALRTLLFSAAVTATSTAGAYKECNGSEAVCLRYFGGPVMRTATVTPVFWNPAGLGLSYPSGYQARIDQFLTGLAADSGKDTNFYSVLPQYYETNGGARHVAYSVAAEAPVEDVDALPAAEDLCTTPFEGSARPCVQDQGVRAELAKLVEKDGLPTGIGHEYVVFFPPGIDSCFDAGGAGDANCSGTGYCGYHGTITGGGGEFEYANEPDNADPQYRYESGGAVFETCATRKGLEPAEATLSSTSHEIAESVTDPEVEEPALSWYDAHKLNKAEYGEVGDICAYEYNQGEAGGGLLKDELTKPASSSNQTIDGHTYLLQDEWDNEHSTCSISERTSSTKALFSDSATTPVRTGETISFDGGQSYAPVTIKTYAWEWGDGTSSSGSSPTSEHSYTSSQGERIKTFTVRLTVTDENGNSASTSHTVEVEDHPPTSETTGGGEEGGGLAGATSPTGGIEPGATGNAATVKENATAKAMAGVGIRVLSVRQNKRRGNLALTVRAPGPGLLRVRQALSARTSLVSPLAGALAVRYPLAFGSSSIAPSKAKGPFVKAAGANVSSAGKVTLQITPNASGRALLARKHKFTIKLAIVFTPTGGTRITIAQTVTFVRAGKRK